MKQIENIHDCYLDLKALSKRSCLSIRTLRSRLKGENPIPYHRVGQKILIQWSAFCAWMENFKEPIKSEHIDLELKEKVDKIITDLT